MTIAEWLSIGVVGLGDSWRFLEGGKGEEKPLEGGMGD